MRRVERRCSSRLRMASTMSFWICSLMLMLRTSRVKEDYKLTVSALAANAPPIDSALRPSYDRATFRRSNAAPGPGPEHRYCCRHYRHCGGFPTIVRFSHKVDTPGLDIQMRVPANFGCSLTPKNLSAGAEGRVLIRTGSAALDRRFNARTDYPVEFKMFTGGSVARASLEQLCCSTQTGFSLKDRTMELSELTIPPFPANHVFDHLQSMLSLAKTVCEMPGAAQIKVEQLPRQGSSWLVRAALAGGLVCLVALLFAQPYSRPAGANANVNASPMLSSGVMPADAGRLQQLEGWHVAKADEFSGSAVRVLREYGLAPSGHIMGDFSGRGTAADSAYLLVDSAGRRRVSLLAKGLVAYDAIFPQIDFLARISRNNVAKIQWKTQAPQFGADGDALLVVQNANDPTASMVLLRH